MQGWLHGYAMLDRRVEPRAKLKLNNIWECLQERRLAWFRHLERMEEIAWSSKWKVFKISGSFLDL